MKCVLKLILIFVFSYSYSSNFENEFNHYSGGKIRSIKIVGERCSGTNFTSALLVSNFFPFARIDLKKFGYKHFLCWYGAPLDKKMLHQMGYGMDAFTLEGSEGVLFVFVVRNSYDWLRSFYLDPWNVDKNIVNQGFSHFLSAEWKSSLCQLCPDNHNPWTGKPFTNVLELRKYRIANYLHLSTLVDHYLMVRYEDVRDDPQGFINFVESMYKLKKRNSFVPVESHRGQKKEVYQQKSYFPISVEDLEFINDNVDWEIENKVGYFPQEK